MKNVSLGNTATLLILVETKKKKKKKNVYDQIIEKLREVSPSGFLI